jgi:hypothetical protein
MRDCLLKQFGASALPPLVAVLLEHAHAIARGGEAAIRVARVSAVQRELGQPLDIENGDSDCLLALAQAASELLGDRLEALADCTHRDGES